jgi:Protein of unknown function (DUF5672)
MPLQKSQLITAYIAQHEYDLRDYSPDFSLDKRAVIIETRPLPNLSWTIRNMAHHTGWPILVYCSRSNEHIVDQLGFPVEKRLINHIQLAEYTHALVSARFWSSLPETLLIFQTDAFMLRSGIEEYTAYDYAGAPWRWAYAEPHMGNFRIGGNGGFSLRKKSKMLEIINRLPFERVFNDPVFNLEPGLGPPEDMYFAYGMSRLGGHVPELADQMRFCVETIFHPVPLAVHGIDRHFGDNEIRKLLFPQGAT